MEKVYFMVHVVQRSKQQHGAIKCKKITESILMQSENKIVVTFNIHKTTRNVTGVNVWFHDYLVSN